MTDETLNERFEASRPRLHAGATRMLGSGAEADDVVQETWLRANPARTARADHVDADPERERPVVDAFLAAARTGDFAALVELLDPEAVFRADEAASALDGVSLLVGAGAVAEAFMGRAQAATSGVLDGVLGVVV